jgi:CheY-like chemotaxis protein
VVVRRDGDETGLSVSDEGEGLSADALERVFGLFVQGERALDRQKGGMGIGLALVKRLVELHGGTVRAESAGLGMGSIFTVRLPAIPAQSADGLLDTARIRAESARRILLVEDNDDVRESLRAALVLRGHEVDAVSGGAEAFQRAQRRPPDVALIDLGLPHLDGFEVARRVRSANSATAIIALTGYGQPQDVQRVREAGFDLHLIKPVSVERVCEAIADLARPESAAGLRRSAA